MDPFDLDGAIRKVRDFPKPGIFFYDITSILTVPEAYQYCINSMLSLYRNVEISAVAAIEARGFLFAAPFVTERGIPLVVIRKKGKLPGATFRKSFALEYGEDTIEIHKSDVSEGMRILIVDDLIATGGTLKASAELLIEAGAEVIGIFAVIGLPFLDYDKLLGRYDIKTLIDYDSE